MLSQFLLSSAYLLACLYSVHAGYDTVQYPGLVKGYYPTYNSVNQGQSPSQLNFKLYTDLIFFAVEPAPNYQIKYNSKLTRSQGDQLAAKFVSLAKKNNVKALVSFGGWIGSRHFSKYTSTTLERKRFANTIVEFTRQHGFDGIEIDWEYPNSAGIGCNSFAPQDTANFGLLLQEIRNYWPKVQISAAIGITGLIGANGSPATPSETANIVQNLNYVNIMAYDVFGAWSPTTGPLAPLRGTCAPPGADQSVETGLQAVLKQGFKPEQILLGIPAYAKRLELTSPQLKPVHVNGQISFYYQNHTKVTPPGGKFDDKPAVDICGVKQAWGGSFLTKELISNGWLSKDQKKGLNGYTRHFDKCSGQPFLTNGRYFITYDDLDSTVTKAQFAKDRKLAGIFFFDTQGLPDSTLQAAAKVIRK